MAAAPLVRSRTAIVTDGAVGGERPGGLHAETRRRAGDEDPPAR